PQPHVSRCITSYPPKVINKKIEIQINFMIKNEGPVIASDLFMNAIVGSIPGRNCKFKFEPPDSSYWIG
ncbi:MAG: hypothetical protein MUO78_02975, partial [candidate division Zixibacteria bacterium]|nr:hypothetical protein [candidate division Zixibacteria bacterium]